MKRICPNCLHENFTGNKYCKNCNSILDDTTTKSIKQPIKAKGNIPVIPIIAVTLVVLVLGTIVGAYFVRTVMRSDPNKETIEEVKTTAPENPLLKRQQFVDGLNQMARERGKSVYYYVQDTSLIVSGDEIKKSDCMIFASSTYGEAAASVGFSRLACRKDLERGDEMIIPLTGY